MESLAPSGVPLVGDLGPTIAAGKCGKSSNERVGDGIQRGRVLLRPLLRQRCDRPGVRRGRCPLATSPKILGRRNLHAVQSGDCLRRCRPRRKRRCPKCSSAVPEPSRPPPTAPPTHRATVTVTRAEHPARTARKNDRLFVLHSGWAPNALEYLAVPGRSDGFVLVDLRL